MAEIKYIVIVWQVPDYGGVDANPYFIKDKTHLLKFLKDYENDWHDIDVYEVNQILRTNKNG